MSIPVDSSTQASRGSATPPPSAPPPPARQDSVSHTVQKGENIAELAARYKVSPQKIVTANPQLHNPNELAVGQHLDIPVGGRNGVLPAQVKVQSGESLSHIGQRYGVSVRELSDANGISNPDMVYPGEQIWVPGAGSKGVTPLDTASGSTPDQLSGASAAVTAALKQDRAAHNDTQVGAAQSKLQQAVEQEMQQRARLELPKGQAPDNATLNRYGHDIAQRYGNDAAVQSAATQSVNNLAAARGTDGALQQLDSAQQALQHAQGSAQPAQVQQLQHNVSAAQTRLQSQLQNEIQTRAGTPAGQVASDADAQRIGAQIARRYGGSEHKAVNSALGAVRSSLQTQSALASAKAQTDPAKALTELNGAYAKASPQLRQQILASADSQAILKKAADQATAPLHKTAPDSNDFYAQIYGVRQSFQNLDSSTAKLDPDLSAALVHQALPAIEQYNNAFASHHGGQTLTSDVLHTGPSTLHAVMSLSGRIAGTAQGQQDVARMAKLGIWNNSSVYNELYSGASNAYPAAMAQQMKAAGQDPGNVLSIMQQGVQADQQRVKNDTNTLVDHNKELNWLTQNLGSTMSPAQLQKAITSYENKDGGKWKADDERMTQQLVADGGTLTQNLKTLNGLAQQNPQSAASLHLSDTVKDVYNDSTSTFAMALAAGKNPALINDAQGKSLLDTASALKLSDQGRKAVQEMGSIYIRGQLGKALNGLDFAEPADLAKANAAIDGLKNRSFANWMLGANDQTTWNSAVNALKKAVPEPGEDAGAVQSRLDTLNQDLNSIRSLSSKTVPGQLLRTIGVASNVASLYTSGSKLAAAMQSQNTQAAAFYGTQGMLNAVGLAQKVSELGVGTGVIKGPSNEVAAKLFSDFASRLGSGAYNSISGAFDIADGVRSATGWLGGTKDGGNAVLSMVTGSGGVLYGLSQLGDLSIGSEGALTLGGFLGMDGAAASTLGLVGAGLVAAGTVGKLVYDQAKAAHQYEGAAKSFLQAGGYSTNAAGALSQQDGLLSGASGKSGVPFLQKYASMKHLDQAQLQGWINRLSHDQLSSLDKCLLQTAGDSKGNPAQFTDGPPQTSYIVDYSSGFATPITLANTLGVFEGNLKHDGVPLP